MVTVILLLTFVVVAGLLVRERLWGSMLMFLNVLAAATMATAWYEPLAALGDPHLTRLIPPFPQFVDVVAAWGLFWIILGVLRIVTDLVSRTRVAFPPLVDWAGAAVFSLLTAWVFVGFAATTFHMSPLPRETVQPTPMAKMFLGLAPDRAWLAWVRGGSLSGPFAAGGDRVFDKDADFVLRYADRRAGNAALLGSQDGGGNP